MGSSFVNCHLESVLPAVLSMCVFTGPIVTECSGEKKINRSALPPCYLQFWKFELGESLKKHGCFLFPFHCFFEILTPLVGNYYILPSLLIILSVLSEIVILLPLTFSEEGKI